jgi:hypothetical protein
MATLPDVKEVLMANGVVICPHCNAQNGGIRRYNPGTHTTLLYTVIGYQEQEPDTEDENICYVCEECGGPLIVDEKTLKVQPLDTTVMWVQLVDANDWEPFGSYFIQKRDWTKFEEAAEETRKIQYYDENTFEQLLVKKGIHFTKCERRSIEF